MHGGRDSNYYFTGQLTGNATISRRQITIFSDISGVYATDNSSLTGSISDRCLLNIFRIFGAGESLTQSGLGTGKTAVVIRRFRLFAEVVPLYQPGSRNVADWFYTIIVCPSVHPTAHAHA